MFLPRATTRTNVEMLHQFATRDESGGISGAAIGGESDSPHLSSVHTVPLPLLSTDIKTGIIAAVIISLIVLFFIIYAHRKRRLPQSHPVPSFALAPSLPSHAAHTGHAGHKPFFPGSPYTAQPHQLPAYSGPTQSVYFPDRGTAYGQQRPTQMPQAVHLQHGNSYYAPAQQEAQKEVRWGQVGVRRYEG